MKLRNIAIAAASVAILLAPDIALAAGAGGALPWDANLTKISQSFTGPFAYAIALIGVVGAGAMLIFAQELPWFLRAVVFIVLAGSFMTGANAFAGTMGWTGSVVSNGCHDLGGWLPKIPLVKCVTEADNQRLFYLWLLGGSLIIGLGMLIICGYWMLSIIRCFKNSSVSK